MEILPTWYQHPGMDGNLMSFFQGSFEIISCTCLHSLQFALFPTVDPKKKFGWFVCMPCMSEVLVSIRKDLCNVEPQMRFVIFQIAICHATWRDFRSITRTNAYVVEYHAMFEMEIIWLILCFCTRSWYKSKRNMSSIIIQWFYFS